MFASREQAGERLAGRLSYLKGEKVMVLAIPRGGLVVGRVISQALKVPLHVLVTRKIGAPDNPELAIGAVGPDKIRVINWELASRLGVDSRYLAEQTERESEEVRRRQEKYGQKKIEVSDKTIILVDDGIATGATIEAAIAWLKSKKAKKIILACPVAPAEVLEKFKLLVDKAIFLETPHLFGAVGQFYKDFPQVSDEEVIRLLKEK